MEPRVLRILAALGIPGVALGIFYLLLKGFGFKFSVIPPTWSAFIAIAFLVTVGGITFYALRRYGPQGQTNTSPSFSKESLPIRQARAFQVSWLVILFVTKNARHPQAVLAQIKGQTDTLDLQLPDGWNDLLCANDQGESVMALLENIGGQLTAQQPELLPYFEAGVNLALAVGRNDGKEVKKILQKLDIPDQLLQERKDGLLWINEVHNYFEARLEKLAS